MPRSFSLPNLPAKSQSERPAPRRGNSTTRFLPGSSEAIWTDDLASALIEALQIYPPMGRLRMRHPQGDGEEATGKQACLGRCQLIQEYLKQKTGKSRTRKQISSRLQRLRRIYDGEPKMMELLRVADSRPDTSQMIDFGVDRETTPTQGSVNSSRRSSPAPAVEINPSGGSNIPSVASQLDPSQDSCFYPSNVLLPAEPDSMSRRRVELELPTLHRQVHLPPIPVFLHPHLSFSSSTSSKTSNTHPPPMPFSVHQSASNNTNGTPITPVEQIAQTPDAPPQLNRSDKRGFVYPRHPDPGERYYLPRAPPYGLPLNAGAQYPPTFMHGRTSPFSTYRTQHPTFAPALLTPFHGYADHGAPGSSPSGAFDDILRPAHSQYISRLAQPLPRRLSYSQTIKLAASHSQNGVRHSFGSSQVFDDAVSDSFYSLELASPADIKPFFTSDLSTPSSNSSLGSHDSLISMSPEPDDEVIPLKHEYDQ